MIQHLSFSQIKSFRDCPKSWFIQKILNEKQPPSTAASRGSQFDALVAYKLGVGEPITEPIIERVEEAVDFYRANGGWNQATEAQKKIQISPTTWDIYREIYDVDYLLPAPIVGYADLIRTTDGGLRTEIVDLKTSERAEYRPDWSLQCALYSLVLRAYKFEVHLLTFTKTLKIIKYSYRPTETTFRWAMNIIGSTVEQMVRVSSLKTVDKIPATPGYWCSWCPRNTDCEGSLIGNLTAGG